MKDFTEYLKNSSTDFYQTYVIFRQLSVVSFEIKRLKIGHSLLPSSGREIMIKEKKSGIFLQNLC